MKEGANETDVREEIAAPLLAALGYERGTSCNIDRERSLKYEYQFLGRKKRTDPPLRGRADYILTVVGAGSWVLEVKAPHEPIDTDAVEQAITYARHPEISASYVAILNGMRLIVHRAWETSTSPPLIDLPVSDLKSLAENLNGLLSPAAIRRNCSPPIVDLGKPLADGLGSHAEIRGGEILYEQVRWSSDFQFPQEQVSQFDEMIRRLNGLHIAITGGTVRRDNESRIRAKLLWAMPHDELIRFAIDKQLMDAEYLAIDDKISTDPGSPTVFDVIGELEVRKGEAVFNLMRWEREFAGITMKIRYMGQAIGYISDYVFQGTFTSQLYLDYPSLQLQVQLKNEGRFHVEVDG